MDNKNAIITASFGYPVEQIRPFINSALRHVDAELVLLVNEQNYWPIRKEYKKTGRVKIVLKSNVLYRVADKISKRPLFKTKHIKFRRYEYYTSIIKKSTYNNVLLSDVRDVVFQDDPFKVMESKVYFGLEDVTIGQTPFNTERLHYFYGNIDLS